MNTIAIKIVIVLCLIDLYKKLPPRIEKFIHISTSYLCLIVI